jgi:hypothetical protein
MDMTWVAGSTLGPNGASPHVEVSAEYSNAGVPDGMPTTTATMIGPDAKGKSWTFCVLNIYEGLWRTVTGWPSTAKERAWYDSH